MTELDELKSKVLATMQATKSERTEAVSGYFIVRAETGSVQIIDPQAVE